MREVLVVFWGIVTGLTAVVGGIGIGMAASAHVGMFNLFCVVLGVIASALSSATVMFVVDRVGRCER